MERRRRDWEDAVVLPSLRGREQVRDEARHGGGGGKGAAAWRRMCCSTRDCTV
jgi:hypothetical protein